MDVSVIIINYNTLNVTLDCINSVFKNTLGLQFEVILIDNASVDGSKDFFGNDQRIRYVYSNENMGFGRANNVGMMLAKGKYILLLNSDTYLVNNAIKEFFDYAEAHEKNAFYGCWLRNKDGELMHSYGRLPTVKTELQGAMLAYYSHIPILNKRSFVIALNDNENLHEEDCKEVGYVTGADLFFHKNIVEKTGWFDHHFFMYCEECDWQRRAHGFGVGSFLISSPQIVHLQDFKKKPSLKGELMRFNSKKYYFKKHCRCLTYIGYRLSYFILRFIPVLCDTNYSFKDRLVILYCLAF